MSDLLTTISALYYTTLLVCKREKSAETGIFFWDTHFGKPCLRKHPLEPADLDELNAAIRSGYGLNEVKVRLTLKEEQAPSQRKAAAVAPSAAGGPTGPVLMGNPIKGKLNLRTWTS